MGAWQPLPDGSAAGGAALRGAAAAPQGPHGAQPRSRSAPAPRTASPPGSATSTRPSPRPGRRSSPCAGSRVSPTRTPNASACAGNWRSRPGPRPRRPDRTRRRGRRRVRGRPHPAVVGRTRGPAAEEPGSWPCSTRHRSSGPRAAAPARRGCSSLLADCLVGRGGASGDRLVLSVCRCRRVRGLQPVRLTRVSAAIGTSGRPVAIGWSAGAVGGTLDHGRGRACNGACPGPNAPVRPHPGN